MMKITDKLHKDTIVYLQSKNRSDAIQELLDHLVHIDYLKASIKLFSFLDTDESYTTSNIGRSVAIPHTISKEVKDLVCVLGISRVGFHYDKNSVHPYHIIMLSLSPENSPHAHRKFLSKFQLLLSNTELKEKIINLKSELDIENVMKKWEFSQMDEHI